VCLQVVMNMTTRYIEALSLSNKFADMTYYNNCYVLELHLRVNVRIGRCKWFEYDNQEIISSRVKWHGFMSAIRSGSVGKQINGEKS